MKKIGRFKLRGKLVRIWRLMPRTPRRRMAYRRLTATPPPSPSHSPPRRNHDRNGVDTSTMVAIWGRCLSGRLCHAPRLSSGGTACGGGGAHGHGNHGKQQTEAKPPPKGHLVVYVGREGVDPVYRVPVPVVYLNHPLFRELLERAEEEFGFHQAGGITIPCAMAEFESVRTRVASAAGVCCRHRGTAVVAVGDGDGLRLCHGSR